MKDQQTNEQVIIAIESRMGDALEEIAEKTIEVAESYSAIELYRYNEWLHKNNSDGMSSEELVTKFIQEMKEEK